MKRLRVPRRREFDLTREAEVERLYQRLRPDLVIHLAAICGGIGINRKKPGTFYYQNLMMGALLMEYARRFEATKFVAIGTICAYRSATRPVKFPEIGISGALDCALHRAWPGVVSRHGQIPVAELVIEIFR